MTNINRQMENKQKIRVLYISDSLKQRFGVTSVIVNYLEYINWDKVQVDLLVYENSEKEIVEKLTALGANVYFMPELGMKSINKFIVFQKEFFSQHNYDIVHSHFNQVDGIIFSIAKKHGVKRCISHSHNTKLSDYPLKAMRNRILCLNIMHMADVCAACSEAAGVSLFGKKYLGSTKKYIIRNAINSSNFTYNEYKRKKIREELNLPENVVVIGHIGSFKLQKNHEFIIEMFSLLVAQYPNYKLVLVGDGEEREKIYNRTKDLGIDDKVIFTGVRKDVSDMLSAFDVFILPSVYEGLPVIGVEAQAASLPCVFSDTITKEVDLTDVTFLPLNDIEKWVNTIVEIDKSNRDNVYEIIKEKGYDITFEGQRITDYYCNIVK